MIFTQNVIQLIFREVLMQRVVKMQSNTSELFKFKTAYRYGVESALSRIRSNYKRSQVITNYMIIYYEVYIIRVFSSTLKLEHFKNYSFEF